MLKVEPLMYNWEKRITGRNTLGSIIYITDLGHKHPHFALAESINYAHRIGCDCDTPLGLRHRLPT